jgi:hypothetical protein
MSRAGRGLTVGGGQDPPRLTMLIFGVGAATPSHRLMSRQGQL